MTAVVERADVGATVVVGVDDLVNHRPSDVLFREVVLFRRRRQRVFTQHSRSIRRTIAPDSNVVVAAFRAFEKILGKRASFARE